MVYDTVSNRPHRTPALLLIGLFMVCYLWLALRWPDGSWDAWAIWNLKARLIYYGAWAAIPDPALAYAHPDYPLLLPILTALGWKLTGISQAVPIILHGAVYLVMLWMVRRSWLAVALVGGAAVLYAPMQNADVPLALSLLCATAAYFNKRDALAGLALGIGVLIKNEGSLIALVFFAAWIVMERRIPACALFAVAPFLLGIVSYNAAIAEPNAMIGAEGNLERLLTIGRYGVIASAVLLMGFTFGGAVLPAQVVSMAILRRPVRWSVPLVAIIGILAGYLAVYAITPHPLEWHLESSLDRLVMQVYPAFVYASLME